MKLNLSPFKSVGPFKFGENVDKYISILQFFKYSPPDEFGVCEYESQDSSFFITVRENKIDSIFCYKELFYKDTNLIGLTIEQLKIITESNFIGKIDELDFEDDGIPQFVYDFETIGLQVWEKNSGIVTIIASPCIEDD